MTTKMQEVYDAFCATVYYHECPHLRGVFREWQFFCEECGEWLDGEEVGQIAGYVESDGTIKGSVGGYIQEWGVK